MAYQRPQPFNPAQFEQLGRLTAKYKDSKSAKVRARRFKSHYGVAPDVLEDAWDLLIESRTFLDNHPGLKAPDPVYLLWALMILKKYQTMDVCANGLDIDEETLCKWGYYYLDALADLDEVVILWENRLIGDTYERCLVTVDGTHFKIKSKFRNGGFIKRFFSYKFNHHALSYELAVCIKTGDIVWINGPFPAATHDIRIYQYKLKHLLLPLERILGDRGYRGDNTTRTPAHAMNCQHARAMSALRGRHETVNRRFKTFGALTHTFRHSIHKHHMFFRSAAVLIQLAHQRGYSHYDVVGYVDPAFEEDWEIYEEWD